MDSLKIAANDDICWFEVTVESTAPLAWKYSYLDDAFNHHGGNNGHAPFRHALGFHAEKHRDTDTFSFNVTNFTGAEQKFTLKITWYQGKTKLNEWTNADTIGDGQQRVPRGIMRFEG
jgi:hypothetical protein